MKSRMLFSLIVVFLLSTDLLHAELFTASAAGVAAIMSVAACPPAAAVVTVAKVVACSLGAAIIYFAKKKKPDEKSKKDSKNPKKDLEREKLLKRNPHLNHNCFCGGEPPEHKDDCKVHPNGLYANAKYHTRKANGEKSPCPDDGQKCLDKSLASGEDSIHRISMEDDMFVVLRKTSFRLFHGYCVTWKEVPCVMQEVLINAGAVRPTGKIVREVAQRIFK